MSDPSANDPAYRAPLARWTRNALAALVCLAMFSMMMLTTADVAGRALLNAPIKGSFEVVTFLLAILVFSSLPLITWDEGHISVNLFENWFPPGLRRLLDAFWSVVGTIVVGGITWRMWIQGNLMAEGPHVTGFLEWPIAPIAYFASVLSGLTTLILAALTWQKLSGSRGIVAGTGGKNPGAD
jgi:TRAP-type C4-dicarboxylate transport system permease small subunit